MLLTAHIIIKLMQISSSFKFFISVGISLYLRIFLSIFMCMLKGADTYEFWRTQLQLQIQQH